LDGAVIIGDLYKRLCTTRMKLGFGQGICMMRTKSYIEWEEGDFRLKKSTIEKQNRGFK
jgi:hypothetical protein